MASTRATEHLNSIGALERAIDVLDPRHLDVEDDVVPDRPKPEHNDVDAADVAGRPVLPGWPEQAMCYRHKTST